MHKRDMLFLAELLLYFLCRLCFLSEFTVVSSWSLWFLKLVNCWGIFYIVFYYIIFAFVGFYHQLYDVVAKQILVEPFEY